MSQTLRPAPSTMSFCNSSQVTARPSEMKYPLKRAAGESAGEPVWRMPLGDAYDKLINTPRADMKNVGPRWGGSITAAQFLQRFAEDIKWAHLDIAGVAWTDKELPVMEKGATAFGVRLLDRFIADNYEK